MMGEPAGPPQKAGYDRSGNVNILCKSIAMVYSRRRGGRSQESRVCSMYLLSITLSSPYQIRKNNSSGEGD